MFRISAATLCLAGLIITPAWADDTHSLLTPDSHGPIGVMGDHTHKAGEIMVSYRYMQMDMDGNREGDDELSDQEVLQQFVVTPTRMTTTMHMFGLMHAPNDRVTMMFMLPFVHKEMDHINRMGVRFTTRSSGIGDIKIAGLIKLGHNLHLNLGFAVPTGSIDQTDDNPASGGNKVRLPYPMQIGSGSYEFRPGVTWTGQSGRWSWGAQGSYVARLDENDNGYTLGDELNFTGWGAARLSPNASVSLRLNYKDWDNIDGEDDLLRNVPDQFIPTVREDLRGGERIDVGVGVNLVGRQGALHGHRLAIEYLTPIDQDLDGPQLQSDGMLTIGWQYSK